MCVCGGGRGTCREQLLDTWSLLSQTLILNCSVPTPHLLPLSSSLLQLLSSVRPHSLVCRLCLPGGLGSHSLNVGTKVPDGTSRGDTTSPEQQVERRQMVSLSPIPAFARHLPQLPIHYPLTHPPFHSSTHPLTHPPIHPLSIHSPTHPLIHPSIHSRLPCVSGPGDTTTNKENTAALLTHLEDSH